MPTSLPLPPGRISLRMTDGGPELALSGEIDEATVGAFHTGRGAASALTGRVVAVDCAEVTFLASVGLRLLLEMTDQTRSDGRRPVLRHAPRSVLRVLELTGLADLFDRQP